MVLTGPGEHILVDAVFNDKEKLAGDWTEEFMNEAGDEGGARPRPGCEIGHVPTGPLTPPPSDLVDGTILLSRFGDLKHQYLAQSILHLLWNYIYEIHDKL